MVKFGGGSDSEIREYHLIRPWLGVKEKCHLFGCDDGNIN